MEPKDKYSDQTYSYLALRKAVGWIGILLPFILMTGTFLIFNGDGIQKTISQYYYTGMRDVLVGALCAIALFMFFYRGYSKWDNRAGNLAGIFALGIAWFPTSSIDPQNLTGKIHFLCATIFFLILANFSIVIFTKKDPDPTDQKRKRNMIYVACGVVMIVSLAAIMIYFTFFHIPNSESHFVFWAETIALIAFGVSWLTKGGSLYPDK